MKSRGKKDLMIQMNSISSRTRGGDERKIRTIFIFIITVEGTRGWMERKGVKIYIYI